MRRRSLVMPSASWTTTTPGHGPAPAGSARYAGKGPAGQSYWMSGITSPSRAGMHARGTLLEREDCCGGSTRCPVHLREADARVARHLSLARLATQLTHQFVHLT